MFWDYFKKKLRFLLVWFSGPLAQMAKGGAQVLDDTAEDMRWLRDQFFSSKADAAYLAEFARSRGLYRWQNESDTSWLSRVVYAYLYWKAGGTTPGMIDVLEKIGVPGAAIENIGLTDQARWAEFRVYGDTYDGNPYAEYIIRVINEIKPARSKLSELILSSNPVVGTLGLGCVVSTHIEC
ncbi:MAG: hypothetical protein OEV42_14780 [Deltaproteobacteria bacterium]|nr:hypothetical protein [Deltaproteobacteria bacterium]